MAFAGAAQAEITFGGSAEFGVASEAGADARVYSNANFEVTFTGTTDGGLEFGATMDASAGNEDYDPGDFEFDGAEDGAFGLGSIFISANGMTLTFAADDIDDLYDDDLDSHDVQFEYENGPISVALTAQVNDVVDAEYSYDFEFEQNGFSAGIAGNDLDDNIVADVGYEMNGFSVGLESDLSGADETVNTVSVGYTTGPYTLSAEAADDDSWEIGVGYEEGAITANLVVENDSVWEVTGAYDLGGDANLIAGLNDEESYYIGMNFAF